MRILLVVNSFASSVTARNTVIVQRRLAHAPDGGRHEIEVVETNRRGHATRLAQDAARRGVDVVVGFGGDGTLNEVATGIAGTEAVLGVLPGGSTNVFARTLGMPNDPVRAAGSLAEAIGAGRFEPIGLGRVNGRFFCFHAGVGFDAAVVETVERRAGLKRWLGHPLFISAALTTWLRYGRSQPHFQVHTDEGTLASYFTIVLNTNPYTYLGNRPLDLSRAASLDRGLVAVSFRTMTARAVVGAVVTALRGGGVPESSAIDEQIDLRHLVIDSTGIDGAGPFPYQLDGDHLGDATRLEFDHVPAAVRLAVPVPSDTSR